MRIKDEVQNVDMLFAGPNQYKIPIYQRHYVWNKNNWEKLWNDVKDMPPNGLFTGIIVTRERGTSLEYDVIDGQQRLTTCQIILCVIRDICASHFKSYHGSASDANEYIMLDTNLEEEDDARYRLLLKEGPDQKAFRDLVDKKLIGSDHLISKAYEYFKNQIKNYTIEELEALYSKVTLGINVAQIELGQDDVSEKIFASLNATGRMLNEFDYLRNDLFLRAGSIGEDLYKSDTYWHPSFEVNDTSKLDRFLECFLEANLGPFCLEENMKPFDLYQENLKKPQVEIKEEFQRLSNFAEFYREMTDSSSDLGKHMQFYEHLGLPRLDSFVLFSRQKLFPFADPLEICNILESYIVRRMLCFGDWKFCYKQINRFFERTINLGTTFSTSDLKDFLVGRCPGDNEVEVNLEGAGFKNNQLILYILYGIETKNRSALRFDSLELLTMEHGVEPHIRNSIGNMTLRTSEDVPSGWALLPFSEKKATLESRIAPDLFLTEKICKFKDWTEIQIKEREQELLESFSEVWPCW